MKAILIAVSTLTLCSLFAADANMDITTQKGDIKEKLLFKGKEHYEKRIQKKAAKKDINSTPTADELKKAQENRKRAEDCARRKDGTIDFIKYKECKERFE